MSDPSVAAAIPPATEPAVVVFGVDDKGKPHASTFKSEEGELAEKAARLMGMRLLRVVDAHHRALALRLPVGRVFASGKAFVPFCKKPLYDQLCALGGEAPVDEAPADDDNGGEACPTASPDARSEAHLPIDWSGIQTGSLVLASDGEADGWFEATVVSAKADDPLLVLQWRDWPDLPQFARRRHQLALLPGGSASQPQA